MKRRGCLIETLDDIVFKHYHPNLLPISKENGCIERGKFEIWLEWL
jgi:hypothetical protein